MKVYIVRHGFSECNKKGIIEGHGNSGLTIKGFLQSILLGFKLINKKFDAVYSSDLKRSYLTAQVSTFGLKKNSLLKIITGKILMK